jgi:hypothetical protein
VFVIEKTLPDEVTFVTMSYTFFQVEGRASSAPLDRFQVEGRAPSAAVDKVHARAGTPG